MNSDTSAEQLARLYAAGFDIETFERFPGAVGIVRAGCIAMVTATPSGLKLIGTPGWRMGEALGVLVNERGREVFRWKDQTVEATPDRIEALRRFREEVEAVIGGSA